ncbi:hypothetical protein CV023_18570 [Brevibacterium sp. CCUG 69071]|nr:hypothetical protein [Brevibacterium sp. CCUG 69071]
MLPGSDLSSKSTFLKALQPMMLYGLPRRDCPNYSQLMTTQIPPRVGIDRWGPLLIVFGVWFVAFFIFIITWLLASDTVVGNPCQGAGFGCFETGSS